MRGHRGTACNFHIAQSVKKGCEFTVHGLRGLKVHSVPGMEVTADAVCIWLCSARLASACKAVRNLRQIYKHGLAARDLQEGRDQRKEQKEGIS